MGKGSFEGVHRTASLEALRKELDGFRNDLTVLKNIWFKRLKDTEDHAQRLESFYSQQAHAYDRFRQNFLWGRRPMLSAVAARMADRKDLVWVDLGGGTGENVLMMNDYLPLNKFKKIYVVDLCHSLCEQAKKKFAGCKNVEVVEHDACTFVPQEGKADIVTFSYSLTMIPPFHDAVDRAISYLCPRGLMGVTDFFVSSKYDLPLRQMPWSRRFFWRSIFDTDNIDIGPERRHYLDHRLERIYEFNSQGSIPYVPYLRAPYYIWLGRVPTRDKNGIFHEPKVEAPALFPPTFLYSQSWEDPKADMEVMDINENDVCLTLTSGGCNSLNLLLHGAKEVVSVDCNPAQSALLELKAVAARQCEYDDFWKLFGEGRHPQIAKLYETRLAPFLSESSRNFWQSRLHYFKTGLYYQGGMGVVCRVFSWVAFLLGLRKTIDRLCHAETLQEQVKIWDSNLYIRLFRSGPAGIVRVLAAIIQVVFLNRFVMWFGGGVPSKQLEHITNDGVSIVDYVARTFDGAARNSHLRTQNYFYYNCLTGKFSQECCPAYLKRENFDKLRDGLLDRLNVSTTFFLTELRRRKYTKVILMDHADWQTEAQTAELSQALADQVLPGGIVIFRSAGYKPHYAGQLAKAGFEVKCLQRADVTPYMDLVNMYASFYICRRLPAGSKAE